MEICVVAINYTTDKQQVHVFLDNVVKRFVDKGIKCKVIAPQSSFAYFVKRKNRRPREYERISPNGIPYKIYSPLYTVFPTNKIGRLCLSDWSKYSFLRAIRKTYKQKGMKADLVYAHFLQAGIPAVMLAQELGVPSYIANGEADTIDSVKHISRKLIRQTLNNVTGIISVSTKCKNEIKELCQNDKKIMNKTVVLPNAADSDKFYKMDKTKCRNELGFPKDKFIIVFTGSFIERKGVQKVAKAVNEIDDVYAIFIGTGPDEPKCRNILFKGRVKNEELSKYLNAADVFVLPTLAEGCSNAIVEALACGLPIISSNRAFNLDILDESCSILIDPESQNAVTGTIELLKRDSILLKKMAVGSAKKAKHLTLEKRVEKIINLISCKKKDKVNFGKD